MPLQVQAHTGHGACRLYSQRRRELHTFAVMPQRLGSRVFVCLAGEVSASMEELRAKAQHQFEVRPLGLSHSTAQKIVNRF
jgi:hypothetical protein